MRKHLADIRHRLLIMPGAVPETILEIAQQYGVAEIVMGKRSNGLQKILMGSVSQAVLESSSLPLVLVETGDAS